MRLARATFAYLRMVLTGLGLVVDRGCWLPGGQALGCAYARREEALAALAEHGVSVVVNLHERPHGPARATRYRLSEVHIPVKDFTAPSAEQLERGVGAIRQAVARGQRVAVHCGGGLGRTGTLLACYLVEGGLRPEAAIQQVRAVRPGSVETGAQEAAVAAYAVRRLKRAGTANASGLTRAGDRDVPIQDEGSAYGHQPGVTGRG